MSPATYRWSLLVVFCVLMLLAGCASLGPQLPMSLTDDPEPNDMTFNVRTLGPDGEFELLSSAEVARRLQTTRGESPLSILASRAAARAAPSVQVPWSAGRAAADRTLPW